MRNYELIQKIWRLVNMKSPLPLTKLIAIENLIKKERPESIEDGFWGGSYILPPKTDAEWMEEMRKYPHRDNHMD